MIPCSLRSSIISASTIKVADNAKRAKRAFDVLFTTHTSSKRTENGDVRNSIPANWRQSIVTVRSLPATRWKKGSGLPVNSVTAEKSDATESCPVCIAREEVLSASIQQEDGASSKKYFRVIEEELA